MLVIITITGAIGGYIPTLFGADALSGWGIFGSTVGGIVGIIAYFQAKKAGYL